VADVLAVGPAKLGDTEQSNAGPRGCETVMRLTTPPETSAGSRPRSGSAELNDLLKDLEATFPPQPLSDMRLLLRVRKDLVDTDVNNGDGH
jgi:hypothetical protein